MKSIKNQYGYSLLQLALIIGVAGFFLIFAFKVVPMYAENRYVESALKSLVGAGEKLEDMTDAEITKKLSNFYLINNVRSEGPTKNIVINREPNNVLVTIDYEIRANLFLNLDIVTVFKNHLDSSRPNECCKPTATAPTK